MLLDFRTSLATSHLLARIIRFFLHGKHLVFLHSGWFGVPSFFNSNCLLKKRHLYHMTMRFFLRYSWVGAGSIPARDLKSCIFRFCSWLGLINVYSLISIHNTHQLLFNRVILPQNLDNRKCSTILNNTNKVMNNNFYKLTYI